MNKKFNLSPKLLAVAITSLFAQQSFAQVGYVDAQLQATSEGERSYLEKSVGFGTKTQTPNIETPISEQVVTQELIKDYGILAPNDLTNVVAGVQPLISYGSTASQWFLIRGFSNNNLNFRDGFRLNEFSGAGSGRDMANVEQVEFVKGPVSSLYGAAQPGGAVNTVTKSAQFQKDFAYANVSYGSFQYLRETIDVNKNFGDVAARINVAHDAENSSYDLQQSKNYLVAPTVRWKIDSYTELEYKGEFQRTSYTGFNNGLPAQSYVTSLPTNYTFSQPWTNLQNSNQSQLLNFNSKFADDWNFRQGLYYATNARGYNFVNPSWNTANSNPTNIQLMSYAGPTDNASNSVSQTEVSGKIIQGAITHNVLGGFEWSSSTFDYMFGAGDISSAAGGIANINTFAPGGIAPLGIWNQYDYRPTIPTSKPGGFSGSKTTTQTNAFYVQDQLSYGDWRVLGSLRNESATNWYSAYLNNSGQLRPQAKYNINQDLNATTGRAGLLYMLTPNSSVYYNYGQGFVPNISVNLAGQALAPERSWQQEAGFKTYVTKSLEGTISAFRIIKNNYKTTDPTNAADIAAVGQVQSKGFEGSLTGQVTDKLRVIVNAASVLATVTSDPVNGMVGQTLAGVPKFSSNLWAVQELSLNLPGVASFGAGVVQVSSRPSVLPNTGYMTLPGYASVNLGAFYKVDNLDFALNLKNINNAVILNPYGGATFVMRQPGPTYLLTAGIKF